jgi:hypothetical protein
MDRAKQGGRAAAERAKGVGRSFGLVPEAESTWRKIAKWSIIPITIFAIGKFFFGNNS